MIALSLVNEPQLVIADEPTTALDATVQSQVLELLAALSSERRLSVLLLTHNLGIVAGICSRVLVMYSGRIVESGRTEDLFTNPQHPYTKALLDAVPRLDRPVRRNTATRIPGAPPSPWNRPAGCAFYPRCPYRAERCSNEDPQLIPTRSGRLSACWATQTEGKLPTLEPSNVVRAEAEVPIVRVRRSEPLPEGIAESPALFSVRELTRHFKSGSWDALDDVTLDIFGGSSVGIVGESGSGKSTLIRLLANLDRPTKGSIAFRGVALAGMEKGDLRAFRRSVQIIFQDPYSSLDPRYTVAQSIREALRVHRVCERSEEGDRVRSLLERVRLSDRLADRYPREMSGGERQRVCIARALATNPEVLLADEPVSSLDVSIQAQIIDLLSELRAQERFTLIIVAHDLALVRQTCDRVVTMYLAQVVEDAGAEGYYQKPLHPYSLALLMATPDTDRIGSLPVALARGEAPSALQPPTGCRYHPRCVNARSECIEDQPQLRSVEEGRRLACFYPISGEQERTLRSRERAGL
jgi:peptide/nickel transport system ATP-binding protein